MIDREDLGAVLWVIGGIVAVVLGCALIGFAIGLGVRAFHLGAGG